MPDISTAPLFLGIVGILSYILGSIPFGMVITRALGLGDLRAIGSGNIGATNVLRTGHKSAAAATLILDAAKGGVAVLIARASFGEDAAQLAGLAAFLGHLFPIWLGFKGGKGVATFLGTLIALSPPVGLGCCAVWAASAAMLRISSLAALIAAASSGVWLMVFGQGQMILAVFVMVVFVYIRHSANIARLKSGTEPKIGAK